MADTGQLWLGTVGCVVGVSLRGQWQGGKVAGAVSVKSMII